MYKSIISKQDPDLEERYYNEITDFMDRNNDNIWDYEANRLKYYDYGMQTYCLLDPNPHVIVIRLPGATMGHIVMDDNNVITEISLYDGVYDMNGIGYRKELKESIKKFIGYSMQI